MYEIYSVLTWSVLIRESFNNRFLSLNSSCFITKYNYKYESYVNFVKVISLSLHVRGSFLHMSKLVTDWFFLSCFLNGSDKCFSMRENIWYIKVLFWGINSLPWRPVICIMEQITFNWFCHIWQYVKEAFLLFLNVPFVLKRV